jgi:hypothetical protein
MISNWCLSQTVHLSYTDTNTISKCIEMRFQMINVTKKIHRVRPKWFMSLWYVRRKSCIYLALRLVLSPNRPKWGSTWASSPRSTIRCVQNDFCAYGTFGANRAPILHWRYHCLQMEYHRVRSKRIFLPMVRFAQTMQLSCTDTTTISKWIEMWFHMTNVT